MHVLPVEKRCCFMRNALLIKTAKSHSVSYELLAKLKSQHTSNAWEFRMEKIWFLTMSLLLIYVGFEILSIVENVGY